MCALAAAAVSSRKVRSAVARRAARDHDASVRGYGRRGALALSTLATLPQAAEAEESQAGMGFLQLPGFGAADISYPEWLLGDWKVRAELASVDTPQGPDLATESAFQLQRLAGKPEGIQSYTLAFLRSGNSIIADRAKSTVPYLKALGDSGEPSPIDWGGEANPDVSVFKIRRGSFDVRVNLRALMKAGDKPQGRDDLYNTQEVFFAATEAPAEVTPCIAVTKFKKVDERTVQQILRFEIYPAQAAEAPAAGMAQVQSGDLGTPVTVVKYLALLSK